MNNQYKININSSILLEEKKNKQSDDAAFEEAIKDMSPEEQASARQQREANKFGSMEIASPDLMQRLAQAEKAAKEPSMGGQTPEEAKIGHAMGVGQVMRSAEQTGKIPVGTFPNQVNELPYTLDNKTELMKYQQDQIRNALKAGATPEQIQVAAGPSSDIDTLSAIGGAATDLAIAAATGMTPKGQRTGGIRFDPKTGQINLPTVTSRARETAASARNLRTAQRAAELGLDQSFAISNPDFARMQPVPGKNKILTGTPTNAPANSLQAAPEEPPQFTTGPKEISVGGKGPGTGTEAPTLVKAFKSKLGKEIGRGLVAGQLATGTPAVSVTPQGAMAAPTPVVTPELPATSRSSSGQSMMPGAGPRPVAAAIDIGKTSLSAISNAPSATPVGRVVSPVKQLQNVSLPGIASTIRDILTGNNLNVATPTPTTSPAQTTAPTKETAPIQAQVPATPSSPVTTPTIVNTTQQTPASTPPQIAPSTAQVKAPTTAQVSVNTAKQQVKDVAPVRAPDVASTVASTVASIVANVVNQQKQSGKSPSNKSNSKSKTKTTSGTPTPPIAPVPSEQGNDEIPASTPSLVQYTPYETKPTTIKVRSNIMQGLNAGEPSGSVSPDHTFQQDSYFGKLMWGSRGKPQSSLFQ